MQSTRHLVDPELQPIVDALPEMHFSAENLPELRAIVDQFTAGYAVPDDGISREDLLIAGPQGAPDVRVVTYRRDAGAAKLPAILFIHGGGYFSGKAEHAEEWCRRVVAEVDCLLVSVDYRLAPETKYPGPIEDCYAALAWLHDNAESLGVDGERIAVQGVSAGGGLAASLCLLARDRGRFPIAFQLLTYPMLDDRTGREGVERVPTTGEFVWDYDSNAFGWDCYLGDAAGGNEVDSYAAAARASDLAGLPPAFVGTGAIDSLMKENVDYALRLIAAGVPTALRVYPGAFHGFDNFDGGASRVGEDFRVDQVTALKRGIGG